MWQERLLEEPDFLLEPRKIPVQIFHERFGFYDNACSQGRRKDRDFQTISFHTRKPIGQERLKINSFWLTICPHVHGKGSCVVRVGPERKALALSLFVGGEEDKSIRPFQCPYLCEVTDLRQEVSVSFITGKCPCPVELFLVQSVYHFSELICDCRLFLEALAGLLLEISEQFGQIH